MSRALRYYLSIVVCGGALAAVGASSAVSGELNLVTALLTVGGAGMVLTTAYNAVAADAPSRSIPGPRTVWFTTACAAVVLVAAAWAAVA